MTESPTLRTEREPALYVALTASETSLEIHGAVPTSDGVPGALHPPLLNPKVERTLTAPASELVLFVLDAKGTVLGNWGWPFRSIAFIDRLPATPSGRGRLHGSVARRTGGLRLLHVPMHDGAAFLYFMRSEIGPVRPDPGRLLFHQRPLALYYFDPEPPPVPPLPGVPPTPEELRLLLMQVPLLPHLVFPPIVPVFGRLLPPELLAGDGTAVKHFNIVIVGDGFKTAAELAEYRRVAGVVCSDLLRTEPFQSRKEVINVWSIPTESADSGVTLCSEPPDSRRTYYMSSGCFDGMADFPGFVGTTMPETVYGAAATALNLGLDQVRAFIVVANCPRYGGGAFPDQRLAFVTMCPSDKDKAEVAVHECGHVIARLADEYIGCCPHDEADEYPNQATSGQVGPPQRIPWVGLAEAHELSGGDLIAVHRVVNGQIVPPKWPWIGGDWLGAYWGCQDFDEDATCDLVTCDPYWDLRGQNFFRPMWDCRMRDVGVPFCRVCKRALDDAINSAVWAMTLMQIPADLRMRTPVVGGVPHP